LKTKSLFKKNSVGKDRNDKTKASYIGETPPKNPYTRYIKYKAPKGFASSKTHATKHKDHPKEPLWRAQYLK